MTRKAIISIITAMLLRFEALNDADKESIKSMCKEAGIKASFNERCKDCYKDALLLLKQHYGVSMPDSDVLTPSGNFIFHRGNKKVVWWWRRNYYELSSQSDDATIEKYMAVNPLQTHFSPNTTTEEVEKGETNDDSK